MIPLAYVIRTNEDVPAVAPPLQVGQPHSDAHGSIKGDLIAWASHTHALFRDDNVAMYYALEEVTRSTSYVASIKPFQKSKNGHGGLLTLTTQYTGNDKWEAEIRKKLLTAHTCVERSIKLSIGGLFCPSPQCICINATVSRAHCIPTSK